MNNDHSSHKLLHNITAHTDIYKGLPPLKETPKPVSFFEFWPTSLVYAPAIIYWAWLTIRYRHPTLPLCSNPSFHLSGMVGEKKSDIFQCVGTTAQQYIAPWIKITNTCDMQKEDIIHSLNKASLNFPLVAKPDMGCRGAGVKLLQTPAELEHYLKLFPENADFLLQKLVPYEGEAGIFYVRKPGQKKGRIFSMAFKYQPYIIGNGKDTLKTLIEEDERARHLAHIYCERHKDKLNHILTEEQAFRLGFSGSHCRGAIFRDARQYITKELEASIDCISKDIKDFHYGRFDVRFSSTEQLQQGKGFTIIEINGASSEAIHIWDANSSFKETLQTLCQQFGILFHIGNTNRKAGAKPPGLLTLLRSWRKEKRLTQHYPMTD